MIVDKQNLHHGDGMLVDILLFGAHPDDVEWGAGGTILTLRATATSFGIVDLTRGEMGSRGTREERDRRVKLIALTKEGKVLRHSLLERLSIPLPFIAVLSSKDKMALRNILVRAAEALKSGVSEK
jgi:hypothetical protein